MAGSRQNISQRQTRHRYYDSYRSFGDYYSHTSSAYKIDYDYEERVPEIKRQKPPEKTAEIAAQNGKPLKKAKRRVSKVVFRKRIDPRIKINKEIVFIIMIIFFGMIGIVYTQAIAQGAFNDGKKIRSQLSEVRIHNRALYTELYENYDKEEIERIAVERLNMSKRKPHQEIYVSVPKTSYIVNNPKPAVKPQLGMIDSIINFIYGD